MMDASYVVVAFLVVTGLAALAVLSNQIDRIEVRLSNLESQVSYLAQEVAGSRRHRFNLQHSPEATGLSTNYNPSSMCASTIGSRWGEG